MPPVASGAFPVPKPPHTIICVPVHTATWFLRGSGAPTTLVGSHLSAQAPVAHAPKHACPHDPQSAVELFVSTQRLACTPSAAQNVSPGFGQPHAPAEHTVPGLAAQSAISRHSTHLPVSRSHTAVGYVHDAFDTHPFPPPPVP